MKNNNYEMAHNTIDDFWHRWPNILTCYVRIYHGRLIFTNGWNYNAKWYCTIFSLQLLPPSIYQPVVTVLVNSVQQYRNLFSRHITVIALAVEGNIRHLMRPKLSPNHWPVLYPPARKTPTRFINNLYIMWRTNTNLMKLKSNFGKGRHRNTSYLPHSF